MLDDDFRDFYPLAPFVAIGLGWLMCAALYAAIAFPPQLPRRSKGKPFGRGPSSEGAALARRALKQHQPRPNLKVVDR